MADKDRIDVLKTRHQELESKMKESLKVLHPMICSSRLSNARSSE